MEVRIEYTSIGGANLASVHLIEQLLAERGFPEPEGAKGRGSVADLYKPGQRCGIYVLLFSDGHAYIGQSVDVVRRYTQHLRVHQDIEAISFKAVPSIELDATEQELIRQAERSGHRLRNVVFSALPPVESDFDLIMSPEEQAGWLSDPDRIDIEGARFTNDDFRRKHARKYYSLRANGGIEEVVEKVRYYVRKGIPAIKRGEVSFWSLSCLPSYANPEITVFMRLNVYWQEVMTIFREKRSGLDVFSFHVAKEPIARDAYLRDELPELEIEDHWYAPGGHDQVNLVFPSRVFEAVMARRSVRTAIRSFNHRLMRKGACNFARHHCLELADAVVEG
ncbi:MAG: GIY-YIG nuclease family protein [Acidobacteria bacterium]|nr:GIY-YIG nuclease family protein [Acidobacteriota bacterium]